MANKWLGVAPPPGSPQDMNKPRTYGGTKTSGGYSSSGFGLGKTIGSAVAGAGGAIVGSALDLGVNYLSSEISGRVSEKYQKRAEERADARNRLMLLDQPSLTAEGRRRAGLNPYGDAVLPGMTSQSTPDTSPGSAGQSAETFSKYARLSFDEQVALARLENEKKVADSQANLNNANAESVVSEESRNKTRFPVELYGLKLSNALSEFNYDTAVDQAPWILERLKNDIEYQKWEIRNAEKDHSIKEETINEKKENIKNMEMSRGLIEAQTALAKSDVSLNDAQKKLFQEQTGLANAQKQYTRLEVKEMYESLLANLRSGYYTTLAKSSVSRLEYEIEKNARTLWDKPDDESGLWYVGNFLWNIQNCLTLSAGASASSGARVVTKK